MNQDDLRMARLDSLTPSESRFAGFTSEELEELRHGLLFDDGIPYYPTRAEEPRYSLLRDLDAEVHRRNA